MTSGCTTVVFDLDVMLPVAGALNLETGTFRSCHLIWWGWHETLHASLALIR
jgi:hypothetical protein